jgi:hypothetical protein
VESGQGDLLVFPSIDGLASLVEGEQVSFLSQSSKLGFEVGGQFLIINEKWFSGVANGDEQSGQNGDSKHHG